MNRILRLIYTDIFGGAQVDEPSNTTKVRGSNLIINDLPVSRWRYDTAQSTRSCITPGFRVMIAAPPHHAATPRGHVVCPFYYAHRPRA